MEANIKRDEHDERAPSLHLLRKVEGIARVWDFYINGAGYGVWWCGIMR